MKSLKRLVGEGQFKSIRNAGPPERLPLKPGGFVNRHCGQLVLSELRVRRSDANTSAGRAASRILSGQKIFLHRLWLDAILDGLPEKVVVRNSPDDHAD